MKPIALHPGRTELVYQAIVDEICDGSLLPGTHLVQEQLAARLGVSRQPVQQAMALLKADGLAEQAPGRGLRVTSLNLGLMQQHYAIRAALDGLAAGLAAEQAARSTETRAAIETRGNTILAASIKAIETLNIKRLVRLDSEFHSFVYDCSGNTLIAATAEPHWRHLRRVMSEVLRRAESPDEIWRQHADILEAIVSGDAKRAEEAAIIHIENAAERLTSAFDAEQKSASSR
jgi:DNA-binding GntR family transcriptional regulator